MAITDRNLSVGTRLYAKYKGKTHTAELVEKVGVKLYRLEDGREFKSPSAAGTAITGKACNGWAFWTVGEPPIEKEAEPEQPKAPKAPKRGAPGRRRRRPRALRRPRSPRAPSASTPTASARARCVAPSSMTRARSRPTTSRHTPTSRSPHQAKESSRQSGAASLVA